MLRYKLENLLDIRRVVAQNKQDRFAVMETGVVGSLNLGPVLFGVFRDDNAAANHHLQEKDIIRSRRSHGGWKEAAKKGI